MQGMHTCCTSALAWNHRVWRSHKHSQLSRISRASTANSQSQVWPSICCRLPCSTRPGASRSARGAQSSMTAATRSIAPSSSMGVVKLENAPIRNGCRPPQRANRTLAVSGWAHRARQARAATAETAWAKKD
jgi:hypothetical protein